MQETLYKHYQQLHQIPEISNTLPKTTNYILSNLHSCEITIVENGGILAYFHKNKPNTIAFRCEMDALPIQETNNIPYKSIHPNQMHACAHDAHMAILLTLANQLPQLETNYNFLLIFEYAEETYGGAKYIITNQQYIHYQPIAIYALHIWPNLPKGQLVTNEHLMATSCEVKIIIHGQEDHIATKNTIVDANMIASEFYQQATLNYSDFFIRFGIIKGGHAPNIICNQTLLHGTIRSLQLKNIDFAKQYLWKLATLYMMRYSNIIEVSFSDGYPPLINSMDLVSTPIQIQPLSFFTTDSFSYYLQHSKGLYALLGTGENTTLHTSNFLVPQDILLIGYNYFYQLAMAEVDQ